MFKSFLLLSAVVSLAVAATPAPAAPPQTSHPRHTAKAPEPSGPTPAQVEAQAMDKAKKLYTMDCALCHGEKGDGKTDVATDMQLTMPDWTNPSTLTGKQDKELFDIIRNGKDKMPPEGKARATDDEVNHLIKYIRSMATPGSGAPAAPPAAAPAAAPASAPQTQNN